jgi:queuine tRNA-ribosyltransferase
MSNFELLNSDHLARRGIVKTTHGNIKTPAFMPVGTAATVKAVTTPDLLKTGSEILLGNTYHLMLRPGDDIISKFGGLHDFMNWHLPILTDSGGYQVFSLSKIRKLTDDGVEFKSHIDGKKFFVTPEKSIEIQKNLNSDIVMCFDECTPFPASHDQACDSMRLSMRWAERCKYAFTGSQNQLFGIVQGSTYSDLRDESVRSLINLDFDGYAVGGLAVGEPQDEMFKVLDYTCPLLPQNRPRYLMGVGKPDDIIGAVARGIDMFDCVLPTRSGRNGQAFTKNGTVNIRNSKFKQLNSSIDPESDNPVCNTYSAAYLHHLFNAKEMLGGMLLSLHNIYFYQNLMKEIRASIEEKRFQRFSEEFLSNYD